MSESQEMSMEDLERLAARMAQAIPDLECPEQCELTCAYYYVERSAQLYREEWEWACLAHTFVRYRQGGVQARLSDGDSGPE